MQLLGEWQHLRGWYPIGDSGFKTQLIHKAWPEARPRKKPDLTADRRRGSFALVVLAPSQLQRTALEQFRAGRIDAPIVMELGLNYGKQHLAGDQQKLANSAVQHPYLVHLSRMPSSRQGVTEDVIAGISERPKIAYVHHDLPASRKPGHHEGEIPAEVGNATPYGRAPSGAPRPPQAGFTAQMVGAYHRQPTRVVARKVPYPPYDRRLRRRMTA